jgi:hypothetical protein
MAGRKAIRPLFCSSKRKLSETRIENNGVKDFTEMGVDQRSDPGGSGSMFRKGSVVKIAPAAGPGAEYKTGGSSRFNSSVP